MVALSIRYHSEWQWFIFDLVLLDSIVLDFGLLLSVYGCMYSL